MYRIRKKYHFYAGHRNEYIKDKCFNLHGHTYYVDMIFELPYNEKTGITMLFSSIDDIVEPIIKNVDHSMLIHINDPLYKYFKMFCEEENTQLKFTEFDEVTSAEHLAKYLFNKVAKHLPIVKIELKETNSSIVTYERSN